MGGHGTRLACAFEAGQGAAVQPEHCHLSGLGLVDEALRLGRWQFGHCRGPGRIRRSPDPHRHGDLGVDPSVSPWGFDGRVWSRGDVFYGWCQDRKSDDSADRYRGLHTEDLAQDARRYRADDRLDIRIAINSGEVTLADNDVFGEPVNVTSRINGIAETGEVFFTEAVYLAMNKMEVPSSEVALLQLKGIAEKIRVYKVVREKPVGDSANKSYSGDSSRPADREDYRERTASQPATAAPTPRRRRRIAALALDAAFCAFFIGALFSPQSPVQIELGDTDSSAAVADDVTIDDKGVRVGDDVEISADRIRVGEALRLDQDGLKIDSKKFDQKTGEQLDIAIDALLKEADRLEALEGPELVSFSLFSVLRKLCHAGLRLGLFQERSSYVA